MDTSSSGVVQYCQVMEDVKHRISVVQAILDGKLALGSEQVAYEVIHLNFRMALEQIAFGSMIANQEKYTAAYQKFREHWHAGRVLQDLEKVNPDFYPVPLLPQAVQPDGSKHFDLRVEGVLTKAEFVDLYDHCGEVLHSKNPYTISPRGKPPLYSPRDWVNRIQALLSIHRARMVDDLEGWIVVMEDQRDGKVHAMQFEALRIHRIEEEE